MATCTRHDPPPAPLPRVSELAPGTRFRRRLGDSETYREYLKIWPVLLVSAYVEADCITLPEGRPCHFSITDPRVQVLDAAGEPVEPAPAGPPTFTLTLSAEEAARVKYVCGRDHHDATLEVYNTLKSTGA